jgi:hypothetical protein
MALPGRPDRSPQRGGPSRRQTATGVPAVSGSPHIAIAPGGQDAGAKVGILISVVGPGGGAGIATLRASPGAGAGITTPRAGPGGGAGIAVAGAGLGGSAGGRAGAGVPVMLGARTIGPGSGLTVIGGLVAAACGVDSSIGEHAPSHSGMALMIATDLTIRLGHVSRQRFSLSTNARSSIPSIGVPWRHFARRLLSAGPAGNNSRLLRSSNTVTARRSSTEQESLRGTASRRSWSQL